jgi:outer membrane usher protein
VANVGMTLAPPYRGGAVAVFDVERVQRVVGKITIAGQAKPHAYGELTVTAANGRSYGSPVGSDGAFYFENVPSGTYSAVVERRGAQCAFTLEIPSSDDVVLKIGTVECTMRAKP